MQKINVQNVFAIDSASSNDAGTYDVIITDSCTNKTTSNLATLTVNPVTAITTQPSGQTKIVGQAVTFSVTAQGTNLTYQWRRNGTAISTATGSSYTIPAAAFTDAGTYDVIVTGGCGTVNSTVVTLTVNNPIPAITVLNPGNISAGVATFTLNITGTNFVSGTVVRWNGQPRETKFVSSTLVTATIPAADIVAVGTSQITVINPSPGGGESNSLSFNIFSGYEADLSPRPNGKRNGTVTISDWVQAGRFVIGLDAPEVVVERMPDPLGDVDEQPGMRAEALLHIDEA